MSCQSQRIDEKLRPVKDDQDEERYSVCQFFKDGTYEYVRRAVSAKEAMHAADHYSSSVGAQIGLTRRVIITDWGDRPNWEWRYGEGVVFPRPQPTPAA